MTHAQVDGSVRSDRSNGGLKKHEDFGSMNQLQFRYGHPGCSYSNGSGSQSTETGAFLVGRVGRHLGWRGVTLGGVGSPWVAWGHLGWRGVTLGGVGSPWVAWGHHLGWRGVTLGGVGSPWVAWGHLGWRGVTLGGVGSLWVVGGHPGWCRVTRGGVEDLGLRPMRQMRRMGPM